MFGSVTWAFHRRQLTLEEDALETVAVQSLVFPQKRKRERVLYAQIASCRHIEGLFWDRVVVETTGGAKDISIGALNKSDARDMVAEIRRRMKQGREETAKGT